MADDQHVEQELPPLDTLAARLEYLFEKIRPAPEEFGDSDESGRKYTNKEIADKINATASETGVRSAPPTSESCAAAWPAIRAPHTYVPWPPSSE